MKKNICDVQATKNDMEKILQIMQMLAKSNERRKKEIHSFLDRIIKPSETKIPAIRYTKFEASYKTGQTAGKMLKTSKVAAKMGVKAARVYQLIKDTKLGKNNFPFLMLGKKTYRFVWKDILSWMQQKTIQES